jgi:hypothetical protein
MSLNQMVNYERNGAIKNEIKAVKLGLTTATDNEPFFISNTGDKQLITRKIEPTDFEYGRFSVYSSLVSFGVSLTQAATYDILIDNPNQFAGTYNIDLSTLKQGDTIDFEYHGFYTNQLDNASNVLPMVGVRFGSNQIRWDYIVDPDPYNLTFFPSSSIDDLRNTPRTFKFNFQVIATSDFNPETNTVEVVASGNSMTNCNTNRFNFNDTFTEKGTYKLQNKTLDTFGGSPIVPVNMVVGTTQPYTPTQNGFVLYFEEMNVFLSKGIYQQP